jgi:hypothetical protein
MQTDTVTGAPRALLRLEGLAMLAAATAAYAQTGQGWALFAALLLAPDVVMLGYLAGPRFGAAAYNIGHTYALPAALGAVGWWLSAPLCVAIALIWLAHIGMDRAAGYGLKYPDAFQHTHLGGKGSER